ncbi:Extended synaptotagmin-3 (E-Syt3) (Chr3Syt) [Durusdinium trenchii]|uniref:Extended synaptotagmin-3 (E-Syt3) (Chr3Syt) n=2 Tax=Durusdinium trenchii TaxID=1381693 RepID=A0ABP0S4S3_9DINO
MEIQRHRGRRRTWNFRPLARLAARVCGACAGCVTACSPAIEPLPKKVLSSEPKEISELWPGEELLNDVIQRLWPSISEWFQRKLKAELEPELKKQLLDIVEFEDIGLGSTPMRLEGITSSMSSEEWGTDVFKSIKCVADLDYSGDGQITVGIRAGGGGAVGHVALTKLKLRGKIVVELAHLTHLPPWFSGIRIYFPDMPEVDLTIDAKVFVLDAFCDTASLVKTRVLKVLREAVANACVLPSRLVLETTTGVDHFRLHHPRPRGVLRTQLEVQSSAEAELREEAPAESRYPYLNALNSWLFDSSRPTSLTSIQVALGACTRNCASGDVLDFVVDDLDQQCLSIFVNSSDTPLVIISLKDALEGRHPGFSDEEAQVLQLPLSFGSATGSLKIQWRQLAKGGVQGDQAWTFGTPFRSSCLLFVDVFHAVGLQAVEDETELWAVVSVRRPFNAAIAEQTSLAVPAASPARHGLQEWRYLGALEHLTGAGADAEVERLVLGNIPEQAWRLLLGRVDAMPGSLPGGVDAVWKQPFCLLLDGDSSAEGPIRKLEVDIEIRRPERGTSKNKSARHERVGSASYGLMKLFNQPQAMEDLTVPIWNGKRTAGHVRVRVQMRPLLAPTSAPQAAGTGRPSLGSLGQRFQFLVRQCSGKVEKPAIREMPRSPPDVLQELKEEPQLEAEIPIESKSAQNLLDLDVVLLSA